MVDSKNQHVSQQRVCAALFGLLFFFFLSRKSCAHDTKAETWLPEIHETDKIFDGKNWKVCERHKKWHCAFIFTPSSALQKSFHEIMTLSMQRRNTRSRVVSLESFSFEFWQHQYEIVVQRCFSGFLLSLISEPYWKSNIRVILFGITYRCAILGIIGVYARANTSLMNPQKWLVIATSLFLLLQMYTFYFSSNVHKNFHVQNLWLLNISIAKRFLRYPKTISPALSSYASFFNFIYRRLRYQFFLIFG